MTEARQPIASVTNKVIPLMYSQMLTEGGATRCLSDDVRMAHVYEARLTAPTRAGFAHPAFRSERRITEKVVRERQKKQRVACR